MKNNELRIQITRKDKFPFLYELNPGLDTSVSLTQEEILAAAAAAGRLGIGKIRLTGGDPLEREDLEELVSRLKATEGIKEVSLTTAGNTLPEKAEALKKAGLDSVDVRIDTFFLEKYIFMTGGGSIDAAMDGLEASQKLGMKPVRAIINVIDGLNDDEILNFGQLALNEPIEVVFCEKPDADVEAGKESGLKLENNEKALKFMPIEQVRKKFKGAVQMPVTDPLVDYIKWFEAKSRIGFISSERAREFGPEILADGTLKKALFDEKPVDISKALKTLDPEKIAEELKEL